jgi:hypothetical protein
VWLDNIKTGFGKIGWHSRDWTERAQDRGQRRALVNMVMNAQVL